MSGNKQKSPSRWRATGKANNIVRYGKCPYPCGKIRYGSRSEAKKAAKVIHPGDHLSSYSCGDWWHFGHPPESVLHGGEWELDKYLERKAAQVQTDLTETAIECDACGHLVYDIPGAGYLHECEVVGVDNVEGG